MGVVLTRDERRFPVNSITVTQVLFVLWMCLTSLFAIYPELIGEQFGKVMKIQLMILVALLLVHTRDQIDKLVWVILISAGFYGVKGGLFTLMTRWEKTPCMARTVAFLKRTTPSASRRSCSSHGFFISTKRPLANGSSAACLARWCCALRLRLDAFSRRPPRHRRHGDLPMA